MREILFRGKRASGNGWVDGCLIIKDGNAFIIQNDSDYWHPVIPETVGQYTGLDDKNGVKIFEGDVLIFDGDKFVILWNDERCGFRMDYWMFDEEYDLSELWPASEVIGNITDNPGLMEW